MNLASEIALSAVKIVCVESTGSQREIDIKRYARVEKIPGGSIEDSEVLQGVMFNKDVTHTRMRRSLPIMLKVWLSNALRHHRRIENPRIILLDCPLEYKKGESQTNVEISAEADFSQLLKLEEEYIQKMCNEIIALKPDLVFTEKGVSGTS